MKFDIEYGHFEEKYCLDGSGSPITGSDRKLFSFGKKFLKALMVRHAKNQFNRIDHFSVVNYNIFQLVSNLLLHKKVENVSVWIIFKGDMDK